MKTVLITSALILALSPAYTGATYGSCHQSTPGAIYLRNVEGFSPIVYKDSAGNATVGFGHMLRKGESFNYITPDQAQKLLETDLRPIEGTINLYVTRPLKANECDSLASFGFNVGKGALEHSTLLHKVNQHEDTHAEFLRWTHIKVAGKLVESKGLVLRREADAQLYSLK